jgi:hypothetical protein
MLKNQKSVDFFNKTDMALKRSQPPDISKIAELFPCLEWL